MVDNAQDGLWNLLGQFGLIVVGAVMIVFTLLAWAGRWRGWAAAPPLGLGVSTLNFFPFTLGLFGLGLVGFGLSANAEFGVIPGAPGFYDGLGVVFCALALLSVLWWPERLAPGWHRDWLAWGGRGATDPWPTEEERQEGRR